MQAEDLRGAVFWEARVDTSHFSFQAFGATREDAVLALRRTLRDHARNVQIPAAQFVNSCLGDANVEERMIGIGYRDGMQFPPAPRPEADTRCTSTDANGHRCCGFSGHRGTHVAAGGIPEWR